MAKKIEEKERILLRNNWQRREQIEKKLMDVVYVANNTVIPICNNLNIAIVQQNVIDWVFDEDKFQEAFVNKEKRESKEGGKFLGKLIEEAAIDDFATQITEHPYPRIRPYIRLTKDEADMLTINRGVMVIDHDKLTEYTNVYLKDEAQITAYHRIEELCKVLDDFFGANIPQNSAMNEWASFIYPTKDGFKVNPNIDIRKYIRE